MYKDCKTPQSAQRQRHIVSCLVCMMQTQTFQEITVQDLCRKADVPRKSFYRYFECKEDVFTAAIDFLIFDFDPIIGFDPSTGFFKTTEYERFIAQRLNASFYIGSASRIFYTGSCAATCTA